MQRSSPGETPTSQQSSSTADSQQDLSPPRGEKDDEKDVLTPVLTYLGRYSSQAFPRYLGLQLRSEIVPKPGPYAFNLLPRVGYYDEVTPGIHEALRSIIDLKTAKQYLDFFFTHKFPACGFMDRESILQRCDNHWAGHSEGLQFEVPKFLVRSEIATYI